PVTPTTSCGRCSSPARRRSHERPQRRRLSALRGGAGRPARELQGSRQRRGAGGGGRLRPALRRVGVDQPILNPQLPLAQPRRGEQFDQRFSLWQTMWGQYYLEYLVLDLLPSFADAEIEAALRQTALAA